MKQTQQGFPTKAWMDQRDAELERLRVKVVAAQADERTKISTGTKVVLFVAGVVIVLACNALGIGGGLW